MSAAGLREGHGAAASTLIHGPSWAAERVGKPARRAP